MYNDLADPLPLYTISCVNFIPGPLSWSIHVDRTRFSPLVFFSSLPQSAAKLGFPITSMARLYHILLPLAPLTITCNLWSQFISIVAAADRSPGLTIPVLGKSSTVSYSHAPSHLCICGNEVYIDRTRAHFAEGGGYLSMIYQLASRRSFECIP